MNNVPTPRARTLSISVGESDSQWLYAILRCKSMPSVIYCPFTCQSNAKEEFYHHHMWTGSHYQMAFLVEGLRRVKRIVNGWQFFTTSYNRSPLQHLAHPELGDV